MLRLFFLDPNSPWRNRIGLVSRSAAGLGGSCTSYASETGPAELDRRRLLAPATRRPVALGSTAAGLTIILLLRICNLSPHTHTHALTKATLLPVPACPANPPTHTELSKSPVECDGWVLSDRSTGAGEFKQKKGGPGPSARQMCALVSAWPVGPGHLRKFPGHQPHLVSNGAMWLRRSSPMMCFPNSPKMESTHACVVCPTNGDAALLGLVLKYLLQRCSLALPNLRQDLTPG